MAGQLSAVDDGEVYLADRRGTGTMAAVNATVAADTQGMSTAIFNVTGTWVATGVVEGTLDDTTWIGLTVSDLNDALFATFTANGQVKVACGGFKQVRLRFSAYTSGTATAVWSDGCGIAPRARVRIQDTSGNGLTSTVVGSAQALDVNIVKSTSAFTYRRLTGNATTTVKSGAGVLHAVTINDNGTGGTITIYDNTAGSGTVIMMLECGTPSGGLLSTTGQHGPVSLSVNAAFLTGLTVVTSGSTNNDVTMFYL